jgi:hypothetical protein
MVVAVIELQYKYITFITYFALNRSEWRRHSQEHTVLDASRTKLLKRKKHYHFPGAQIGPTLETTTKAHVGSE